MRTREWVEQRIERVTESGCWLWLGRVNRPFGYGRVVIRGKAIGAHKLVHELYKGAVPGGLSVLHHCDVRCCVNPAHLYVGTQQDNVNDAMRRGRHKGPPKPGLNPPSRGEANGSAKLNDAQVLAIRARAAAGEKQSALAVAYGLHPVTVYKIVHRKKWAHI